MFIAVGHLAKQRANKAEELIRFIVTVHDYEAIGHVALKLEALGVDVDRVVKLSGALSGRGPIRLLSKITALPGVKDAHAEPRFELPSPHGSVAQ